MFDLIISWAAEAFGDLLEDLLGIILPVFGFSFDAFARTFPFAATAYGIFQSIGMALALLITGWHLLQFALSWFGVQTDQLKTSPLRQLFQGVLAVVMIYYGNYLFNGIIDIAQLPFNALLYAENDPSWSLFQFGIASILDPMKDLFLISSPLLYLILILVIGWNIIKVFLEAIERYVMLFILIYLSPLASCTLASTETSTIFKRFFSMFISQCVLLLFNVWTIKMAISCFSALGSHGMPMIGLLMGYSFLRISLRMDTYLNQLGLNSAVTGAGLGMELAAMGGMVIKGASKMFSGIMSASSGASLGSNKSSNGNPNLNAPRLNTPYNPALAAGASSGGGGNPSPGPSGSGPNYSSFMPRMTGSSGSQNSYSGSNSGTPYNAGQSKIAGDPSIAGSVMTAFQNTQHETSDPKNVSAVLEGIGGKNANPAIKRFVSVGTGAEPSIDNGSAYFKLNSKGIHAFYSKGGTMESLDLHNAAQYNALDSESQRNYQQFTAKTGETYYYKTKTYIDSPPQENSTSTGSNGNSKKKKQQRSTKRSQS